MTLELMSALFRLRAEADAANQPFLAHLIGLAILEANEVIAETPLADGSRRASPDLI